MMCKNERLRVARTSCTQHVNSMYLDMAEDNLNNITQSKYCTLEGFDDAMMLFPSFIDTFNPLYTSGETENKSSTIMHVQHSGLNQFTNITAKIVINVLTSAHPSFYIYLILKAKKFIKEETMLPKLKYIIPLLLYETSTLIGAVPVTLTHL